MFNRTVEIHLTEEFTNIVANTQHHANNCIGYLSMWAIHSERYSGKLTIYGDKDGCLNATYRNKAGDVTYSMYGLRREDGTYSTHS